MMELHVYLIHLLSHCLVISLSLNPSQHTRPLTLKWLFHRWLIILSSELKAISFKRLSFWKSTYPVHSRLSINWNKSKEKKHCNSCKRKHNWFEWGKYQKTTNSMKYNLISFIKQMYIFLLILIHSVYHAYITWCMLHLFYDIFFTPIL